jgi:2-polyprenyl-6-methoxyphenol hydroxylase-like FAD-dependent oxidoreductase
MSTFRVVIVGGSIAGLTLANILERYKIDYIVLEKHATIAPQLGASIATLPHGARILDQLGIFSQVAEISMSVHEAENIGPDGRILGSPEPIGDLMEELSVINSIMPVLED